MQPKRKAKPKESRRSPLSSKKVIFYRDDRWIGAVEASKIANVSRQIIHEWCEKFGIGRKVGRNYRIDPIKLEEFLHRNTQPMVIRDHKSGGVKTFKCPYGYKFGIDYDDKPKCEKCNQIVWLHCGRRNEKIYFIEQAMAKSEKLYTKREINKKIKEMEDRL